MNELNSYKSTGATSRERLFLNRWTTGFTTARLSQMRAAGGPDAWFAQQLQPAKIADAGGAKIDNWLWSSGLSPSAIVNHPYFKTDTQQAFVEDNRSASVFWYSVMTSRQVQEKIGAFWGNIFYVGLYMGNRLQGAYAGQLDRKLRELGLGYFPTLFKYVITQGALLTALDANTSLSSGDNRNLGREILELHSVGVGSYTEADVTNAAKLLTGYGDTGTGTITFTPSRHQTGAVKIMGWSHPNSSPDGRAAIDSFLGYLASHPATISRMCKKLAIKFVSDNPSAALISALQKAWTSSGGNIAAVLKAMVAHPDFAVTGKLLTPWEELARILTHILQSTPTAVADVDDKLVSWMYVPNRVLLQVGQQPHHWSRPNGQSDFGKDWQNLARLSWSSNLLARMVNWPRHDQTALSMPTGLIRRTTPTQWGVAGQTRAQALNSIFYRMTGVKTAPANLHNALSVEFAGKTTVVVGGKEPVLIAQIVALSPRYQTRG